LIVGLDMGGTNIDAVVIADGQIIKMVKRPTDRENLFQSIWAVLEELLAEIDKNKIKRINLSTTVSTNAIVEKKADPVGMIIQRGPGLPYDFQGCTGEKVFISGYIDHRGHVVKDLELREIKKAKDLFKEKNIKACAVVTKFSIRNPSHELRIKKLLAKEFSPITLGHTLSGKLNFPRRVYTSYLNAAVSNTFQNFAGSLKKSLAKAGIEAPVFILKADGGTMNLATAEEKPVETILSGPAASLLGLMGMCSTEQDALLLDIGGTTTDIFFLADGVPVFEPLGIKISGYKTLVRAIYSVSIGLGGDSSIRVGNDTIQIGPQREGPPYAFGGPAPTPTDGMIVLGLMEANEETLVKARQGMEKLGRHLGLSPEGMADKVLNTMGDIIKNKVVSLLQELNEKPVYTIQELLYGKKIEPQVINIIGGPAKALAPVLSKKFNLPCHHPSGYQVANAIGAALARITTEITLLADTAQGILSVPELGIHEKVSKRFTLEQAREKALTLLKERAAVLGANPLEVVGEIIEESSFNMVRGFSTSGKNIRIKAQVKPDLSYQWRGEHH
jgi:N-methylhydantoinase A/oxoprolinase/acetone carboxylase beta subunit